MLSRIYPALREAGRFELERLERSLHLLLQGVSHMGRQVGLEDERAFPSQFIGHSGLFAIRRRCKAKARVSVPEPIAPIGAVEHPGALQLKWIALESEQGFHHRLI